MKAIMMIACATFLAIGVNAQTAKDTTTTKKTTTTHSTVTHPAQKPAMDTTTTHKRTVKTKTTKK